MQKQVVIVLQPFFSFLLSFQECKAHNMLNMMLDPCFKGLGLVIQYVGKEKTTLIASEYDMYVLFPLLVHVYMFLNSSITSETIVASTSTNYEVNILNHYRIRKVSDENAKACLHGESS
jgi:hypothetical protein